LSAKEEWEQESVAAEREEAAVANTSALRHKRPQYWQRGSAEERGQRRRAYRHSCKTILARLSTRKRNRRVKAVVVPARSTDRWPV